MLPVISPPNLYEPKVASGSPKIRSTRKVQRKKEGGMSMDLGVDSTGRNTLVHIPDLAPRDKVASQSISVSSVFTEQVAHLNRLINQEQFRLDHGVSRPPNSQQFLTNLPDGLDFAKQPPLPQKSQPPDNNSPSDLPPSTQPPRQRSHSQKLVISGKSNQVPKLGQRPENPIDHLQRILSKEGTRLPCADLVPSFKTKKHALQQYLNAYLHNYGPFLRSQKENLPQMLRNVISSMQHQEQLEYSREQYEAKRQRQQELGSEQYLKYMPGSLLGQ